MPGNLWLDAWHCKFYLLRYRIILHSSILGLYSEVQLNYLKQLGSFWALLLRFVRKARALCILELCPPTVAKPEYSLMLHELCSFPGWLLGTGTFRALYEHLDCPVFFSQFLHECANSLLTTRGEASTDLWSPLSLLHSLLSWKLRGLVSRVTGSSPVSAVGFCVPHPVLWLSNS